MNIKEIFNNIEYTILNQGSASEYSDIEYDSRKIKESGIFAALEGAKADGHDFIDKALALGAKMVIVSKDIELSDKTITVVKVPNLRQHLGIVASNFYKWPQNQLTIVGVTGTKGKTTSTYLMENVLGSDVTARIGTIEYKIGDEVVEANNTTPESLDIVKICRRAVDKGMRNLVMEVSSHALDMGRVEMLSFDVAVFNNLTQDHLDYHKTMENYFQTKLRIFSKLKESDKGIINIDDPWIKQAKEQFTQFITFSQTGAGDINGTIENITNSSMDIKIEYKGKEYKCHTNLVGKFNLYNIMGAFGVGIKLGMDPDTIIERIKNSGKVPGRFELVSEGQDFMVVVDYAHTDASLDNVLATLDNMKKTKIITVFGAGGDRDRTKRPKMAKAAVKYSDFIILTSDNPRTEDPFEILKEVESGLTEAGYPKDKYLVIENRHDAIKEAVNRAYKDDIVLIAGKGHENYQIIGSVKHHFDDREEAAAAIKNRAGV